ncbi:polysaccharide pyruvyl transferase family protein [Enterococcus casseliflavus]|uniref:polysaccharide pyruvyl transferase family protein n=1 Tax=Enterococcus casseliflavus TaxID=37734 RepID=UPI001AD73A2D|nr:polysaccharide pyruvyl transferase family protein [Enterococcus casseliflavus]EME8175861.1 polysaccharide pyruvyl transferase family protein [Enterococcus faecium]MBO6359882.1 polysaccharide pyruvyl transferase family protein [Enterococcus casseliflavus]MBO6377724.1 polysaccharide pyruvyl transferase family protein [Enterococcus casseliflavus]
MRILLRAPMSPLDNYSAEDLLKKDRFGVNVGNLVYQYSVYRMLYNDENTIEADGLIMDPNRADWINENFDMYILPFADAFRPDFRKYLTLYTRLFNKLKIPICILGIGIRAPYEPDFSDSFVFDDEVRAFMDAALEKSSIVGLRGNLTGKYLSKLGYIEDKHFLSIGCPSMYTFGRHLSIKKLNLTKESKISLNGTQGMSEKTMDYLYKTSKDYHNHVFVPQVWPEMVLGYLGGPSVSHSAESYPFSIDSDFYKEGKVKFFLNAQTWFQYMQNRDFSFGTRLHGNITATINGTPSLTIASDARVRELVEFHKLPSFSLKEFNDSLIELPLSEIVKKVDLSSSETVHNENFSNYISFLERNNIRGNFSIDPNRKFCPLDDELSKINFNKPVESIISISDSDKVKRLSFGLDWYKHKKQKEVTIEKEKYTVLNKKIQDIKKIIN